MRSWHRWRSLVIVCYVFCISVVDSFAQECRLTTTARVLNGHDVSTVDLAPERLSAKIGGNPAKVVSITREPKPFTVLVIDSSSMKPMWGQSVATAKQLSASAGEDIAVVLFREAIRAGPIGRKPTNELLDRLDSLKISTWATALWDTLVKVAGAAKNPNTALVVISDGQDNASSYSSNKTVDSFLKNHWPPVFSLVLDYSEPHLRSSREGFSYIVAGSGGAVEYPSSAAKVTVAVNELSTEINTPFMIVLQASQPILKPQKLELEVVERDRKRSHEMETSHVAMVTGCDERSTSSMN